MSTPARTFVTTNHCVLSGSQEAARRSAFLASAVIAFEKGTLDDEDSHVRDRLATLKSQSTQSRGRKAQLEIDLEQPPQTLTPGDRTKIRDRIREILSSGLPTPARPCARL